MKILKFNNSDLFGARKTYVVCMHNISVKYTKKNSVTCIIIFHRYNHRNNPIKYKETTPFYNISNELYNVNIYISKQSIHLKINNTELSQFGPQTHINLYKYFHVLIHTIYHRY